MKPRGFGALPLVAIAAFTDADMDAMSQFKREWKADPTVTVRSYDRTVRAGRAAVGVSVVVVRRKVVCDCIASGNTDKPKQHGADPHAKNCAVYIAAALLNPPKTIITSAEMLRRQVVEDFGKEK